MSAAAIERNKNWRLRHYLCAADQVMWRITTVLHKQWLDGIAFPELANTKQKILEVYVGRRGDTALLLDARGNFYSFDSHGVLDLGAAVEAIDFVLEGSESRLIRPNVIDIGPTLRHRRWVAGYIWEPTQTMLEAVRADLAGPKGANRGKIATIGAGLKTSQV